MEQSLLSELCGICHSEKPKYRCPRCRAQTCSLQCYKRHQQRASCSGKRDPATFVNKTQWATPAGIDRDYNYLKGVERTVHDAAQDALGRGIGVEPPKSKVATRGWRPDSLLQKYLNDNRITVQHAPLGMSRQKTNDTRVTKSGNVFWTIEWAGVDEKSHIQHNCLATNPIAKLHAEFQTQTRNAEKRRLNLVKPETIQDGPKRKRVKSEKAHQWLEDGALHQEEHLPQHLAAEETSEITTYDEDQFNDNAFAPSQPDEPSTPTEEKSDEHCVEKSSGSASPVNIITHTDATQEQSNQLPARGPTRPQEASSIETRMPPTRHYFLLKPGTAGVARVLIPLDSQTSLTDSLRGQVVQEYPTIYALTEPPNSLPAGFLLEGEYLNSAPLSGMNDISQISTDPLTDERLKGGASGEPASKIHNGELDSSSILAMLKRDITL